MLLLGGGSHAFAQQLDDRERSAPTQYAWYYDVSTAVVGDLVSQGYRIIDVEVTDRKSVV